MPNKVLRGVYQTTVLDIRRGQPTGPYDDDLSELYDTYQADVVVNGIQHKVEFHVERDGHGYSSSESMDSAFPWSKDAPVFLGRLAERLAKGEKLLYPIEALI
jgi:hypothetical protein